MKISHSSRNRILSSLTAHSFRACSLHLNSRLNRRDWSENFRAEKSGAPHEYFLKFIRSPKTVFVVFSAETNRRHSVSYPLTPPAWQQNQNGQVSLPGENSQGTLKPVFGLK
jgi:hypothetical protein